MVWADVHVCCPYNSNHVVLKSKLPKHLIKCEKVYPQLAICPYNATHRMPMQQVEEHLRQCDSRAFVYELHGLSPNISLQPVLPRLSTDENWE